MLTGTLVTVAGFIPIGLNGSAAGEYTFTLFVVIAVSLLVSWIVAVLFTPLLGVALLPATMKAASWRSPAGSHAGFTRLLLRRDALALADHRGDRWRSSLCAVVGMRFVQQQFFPASDRPELIVDWTLPQNSSIAETKAQMERFETSLVGDPDIDHWSSYIGQGAPRFILSFDVQPANPYFGQIVIVTKGLGSARARQGQAQGDLAPRLRRHRRLRQAAGHSDRRSAGRCSIASAAPTSRRCASCRRSWRQSIGGNPQPRRHHL